MSNIVNLYISLVQRGLKTIEQVPESIRVQVEEGLQNANEN